jgi:hypothetical protein
MQVKPFVQFIKFYSKFLFCFENLLFIVLKDCFEIYKIICLGLNGFESVLKELGKQKRKTKRTKKKIKGLGAPFWPGSKRGPRPSRAKPRRDTLLSPLLSLMG